MTMLLQLLLLTITGIVIDRTDGFILPCMKSFFKCGSPAIQPDTRIVGGQSALRGAWPWTVLLLQDRSVVCGAAIISERFILTAAHCFTDRNNSTSRWKIIAGKQRLDKYEASQQSVGVNRIIIHDRFNTTTLENDIAIVVLSNSLSFSTLIQPICLPESSDKGVTTGEMCLMAGWGDTQGTGDHRTLNQVEVPVIADDVCSKQEWYGSIFYGEKTFCAGYEDGGKDACHGDSGGPLICKDTSKWVVQGIASWGIDCGAYRWPGIYTEVSKFVTWIHDQMNRVGLGLCNNILG